MNKENFFAMEKNKRVDAVNKLLAGRNQSEVAEIIGLSQSVFSKEMTKGDYIYITRENKYFKFIRDGNETAARGTKTNSYIEELDFLSRNLSKLMKLVETSDENVLLSIDKEIYGSGSIFVNKNIRINQAVYEKFINACGELFPHLKIQDLIAQSLLDFLEKYTPNLDRL